jgi:hypothetical protein
MPDSAAVGTSSPGTRGQANTDSAIDTVSLALLMGATFVAPAAFPATSNSSSR